MYISPPFSDFSSFNRAKRFFIRSRITIDADDRSRIIRISVEGAHSEQNVIQLRKLHLIEK